MAKLSNRMNIGKAVKRSIGIIGYGRFGKLAAQQLKKYFRIKIYDKAEKKAKAGLKEAAACDIVLMCVPISEMENSVRSIRQHIRNGALVMDVCSVKEHPAKIMKKLLPKHAEIIATHPLFGPDSWKNRESRKIVVCRVRASAKTMAAVNSTIRKLGLKAIFSTPQQHDKEIAKSLALVHTLGRAMAKTGLKKQEIDTLGYRRLLAISGQTNNDTMQLYRDMMRYNRFVKVTIKKFIKAMENVSR